MSDCLDTLILSGGECKVRYTYSYDDFQSVSPLGKEKESANKACFAEFLCKILSNKYYKTSITYRFLQITEYLGNFKEFLLDSSYGTVCILSNNQIIEHIEYLKNFIDFDYSIVIQDTSDERVKQYFLHFDVEKISRIQLKLLLFWARDMCVGAYKFFVKDVYELQKYLPNASYLDLLVTVFYSFSAWGGHTTFSSATGEYMSIDTLKSRISDPKTMDLESIWRGTLSSRYYLSNKPMASSLYDRENHTTEAIEMRMKNYVKFYNENKKQ